MGVQVLHDKEKFDLMTGGGGDKNRLLEGRGLCSLSLKNPVNQTGYFNMENRKKCR